MENDSLRPAMPRAWNEKDERQFEHIKQSVRERGKPEEKAEEIAARMLNKTRRKEERTPNKTTQGTGNPNIRLEERNVNELRNLPSERDIEGRSKMKKREQIEALRKKIVRRS